MKIKIHKTAEVNKNSVIGKGTMIWNYSQIRENAVIGKNCILGKNVYIDEDVIIGNNVKIQNNVSIYKGAELEDGVFIGPHVVFANDKYPRSITSNGVLKKSENWEIGKITVKTGASIGANSTVLPGIIIGKYAMIGAGSVITRDIPDFALAYGNPAEVKGRVDKSGVIKLKIY